MNRNKDIEINKKNIEIMTDEQKQKQREANRRYQKKYRDNMTDEQKQKRREANKRYRDNMSDEQKQKLRDYQIDYPEKYHAAKKLNNKITNDNDNDFYCISIIIIKKYSSYKRY